MGDRVALMKDGVLQQVDTPLALYDNPANLFVAGFIGSPAMNLLQGQLTEGGAKVGDTTIPLPVSAADRAAHSGSVTIGIRPENLRISDDERGLAMKVLVSEELGADAFLYGCADTGDNSASLASGHDVVVRVEARRQFPRGSTVHVSADPKDIHVFNTETGERIGTRESRTSGASSRTSGASSRAEPTPAN